MAAGRASSGKKGKTDVKEVLQQQEIIQAVVIADSFSEKLLPLTSKQPTALLPVVNRVLLDYVLQSLEDCGIQETFVFCSYLSPQIRNYISNSIWSRSNVPMTVTVISSESFMSVGDVLRELDAKNLIRSDFILMNGDVISTLPLLAILEEHKKCKQNYKGLAMTVIYRQALPKHKTRCSEDDYIIALDPFNKIRYFQKVKNGKPNVIPLEVFQENSEVLIRYDLINCHISICSPSLPPLYSDNFDYQTQDDLVKGLLVNEDIMNCSVHVSIAECGYGACISNMYMYDVVSQDIMHRWTYPVVPDNFPLDGSRFNYMRHNVYKEGDIELGRGCCIEKNVVIGKGSKIGDNSVIKNSIIGQNCIIGANVHIVGSYLWNNVNIGDGCILDTCLLADNVILKENVKILPGSVLSYNVVIGKGISVPKSAKLQAEVPDEDSDFGDEDDESFGDSGKKDTVCDPKLVGADGRGFLCPSPVRDDENEKAFQDLWGQFDHLKIEDEDDEELDDSASSVMSGASETLDNANDSPYQDDDALSFYNEVHDSLQRGIEEKIKVENLILEINSSKHAYNVTIKEVNSLVIKAILKLSQKSLNDSASPQEFVKALHSSLQYFNPLLSNYIKSASSQMDCLLAIEEFMGCNKEFSPAFVKILSILYDKNILSETAILKWHGISSPDLSSEQVLLRKQADGFVKWLQEAEEESTDESSSED